MCANPYPSYLPQVFELPEGVCLGDMEGVRSVVSLPLFLLPLAASSNRLICSLTPATSLRSITSPPGPSPNPVLGTSLWPVPLGSP
jgi:hypothetical protein